MLVESTRPELQPDIKIRAGCEPRPCFECGGRAIYEFAEKPVCQACATTIQATINRLTGYTPPTPGVTMMGNGTIGGINRSKIPFWRNK